MTTKEFDVFISHSSVDKPWVIELKEALEGRGIKVWLDNDEIRPGEKIAKALERGIEASRSVALVVSPESMKSGWVREEYDRALELEKAKRQPILLIPIILRTAKVPGFLSTRRWVDFRDENTFKENVDKVIWGITGRKEKPKSITDIPFVIAAMTKQEASDLFINGKAKNNAAFTELRATLAQQTSVDELIDSYGDRPEDWQLLIGNGEKISVIIRQTLDDLNLTLQDVDEASAYIPMFLTSQILSKDPEIYLKAVRKIKQTGCVLVIDAISLFHEDVVGKLKDLQIESNNSIAVAVISPIDTRASSIVGVVDKEVKDQLQVLFYNFAHHLDRKHELGVSSLIAFKRWMNIAVPEISNIQKVNREKVRERMPPTSGINRVLFG
jgi:hypothetical protein